MAWEASTGVAAAYAPVDERMAFIRKTYLHLGGAVLAFIAVEAALLSSPFAGPLAQTMLGSRWGWMLVLGLFMAVGYVADRWARSATSPAMQYAGLGLYVVAEAIIMLPLLYVAANFAGNPNIIPMAGIITLLVFTGLTGTVLLTKHDFSWLRTGLTVAGFAALGLILASIIFGFTLGAVFAAAMLVIAAGYILYSTSNVLHHYPVGSHVAAALALFAAVALFFYYVVMLLLGRSRD